MVVRQDEAVAGPVHTCTDAPALTAYLYDAPLRILYHRDASQGG